MFYTQLVTNFFLFLFGLFGILTNGSNILVILMSVELMLLGVNLNFIVLSILFDDIYCQIFSLFILTIAASESAIGLAILILRKRTRGDIQMTEFNLLKY